ncbi:MAG: hypothetical protein OXG92_09545 [Chloroflexi bacterium]|nr:hypothetical protein [Chloroflexota bacterium]MCY3581318.1 hypothetical protein [Chloroflexota bacterium]MCY3716692.1 hypothetical protein [Chloroflexota bacterium]MDE2649360.1 hypothetical protein [Chloroflexota bacterium]MXV92508.1 hypothetical protein [Chloroflexota bacterium]
MSDEQRLPNQDMMQAAIDGQLSEEMARRLREALARDNGAAREYSRLQRVESMLQRAPHERAPARLAATIMARVAERVQAQARLADLPIETQRIMMLSLSAAMMATMPMLEAASWLVLNAQRDPEVLSDVMLETISWMSLITDALIQLLEDAESRARSEPIVATATLALTPYLLGSLLDYLDELPKMGALKT